MSIGMAWSWTLPLVIGWFSVGTQLRRNSVSSTLSWATQRLEIPYWVACMGNDRIQGEHSLTSIKRVYVWPIENPRAPLAQYEGTSNDRLWGFRIAGDQENPGPIYNYARIYTWQRLAASLVNAHFQERLREDEIPCDIHELMLNCFNISEEQTQRHPFSRLPQTHLNDDEIPLRSIRPHNHIPGRSITPQLVAPRPGPPRISLLANIQDDIYHARARTPELEEGGAQPLQEFHALHDDSESIAPLLPPELRPQSFKSTSPPGGALKLFILAFLFHFLITLPAFLTSFYEPPIGLGCHSGALLLYFSASVFSAGLLMFSAWLSKLYFQFKEHVTPAYSRALFGPFAVLFRLLGTGIAWGNALWILAYCFCEFIGLFQRCYCDCLYIYSGNSGWLSFLTTDQIKDSVMGYWIGMLVLSLLVVLSSLLFLWCLPLEYIKKGKGD